MDAAVNSGLSQRGDVGTLRCRRGCASVPVRRCADVSIPRGSAGSIDQLVGHLFPLGQTSGTRTTARVAFGKYGVCRDLSALAITGGPGWGTLSWLLWLWLGLQNAARGLRGARSLA